MESKYYISLRPQTNELHLVHKEGCPFLPDDGKRIFLGDFRTSHEAERSGSIHFIGVKQCLFCCREKHGSGLKVIKTYQASQRISPMAPALYLQDMICCIN
jgi:hypothetical protein